jgi:hypothetical protein
MYPFSEADDLLEEIKAIFSKTTDNDLKNRDEYLDTVEDERRGIKKTPQEKKTDKPLFDTDVRITNHYYQLCDYNFQ